VSDERIGGDKAAARAEAQRARILDAAQQCFIADGFQPATIALIAERAGISAGLIYRYFENKDAIVLAIIERELVLRRGGIATLHGSIDLAAGLAEKFGEMRTGGPGVVNAALFLEMSAEAPRDEKIAAALRHADQFTRADFAAWLARPREEGGRGFMPEEAASRSLVMQLVFEGLAVRCAREPGLDRRELQAALALALQSLA
jgi:AcrR family transcriptional regulator